MEKCSFCENSKFWGRGVGSGEGGVGLGGQDDGNRELKLL